MESSLLDIPLYFKLHIQSLSFLQSKPHTKPNAKENDYATNRTCIYLCVCICVCSYSSTGTQKKELAGSTVLKSNLIPFPCVAVI
jgi:hypothetical protein